MFYRNSWFVWGRENVHKYSEREVFFKEFLNGWRELLWGGQQAAAWRGQWRVGELAIEAADRVRAMEGRGERGEDVGCLGEVVGVGKCGWWGAACFPLSRRGRSL